MLLHEPQESRGMAPWEMFMVSFAVAFIVTNKRFRAILTKLGRNSR